MVLEFKIENFRSFKEVQVFSFVAEATKSKANNVFEVPLPKDASVRLLKSAVVYGANASGKSNFLKAFYNLQQLIIQSDTFRIGKAISQYEPFLLDKTVRTKPTKFELTFLLKHSDFIKYRYTVEYNDNQIIAECLDYYPNGQVANLYKRKILVGDYHEIEVGKALKRTGLPKKFLKNQLILSKFGSEPHEQLNLVYRFFDNMSIGNALDEKQITYLIEELGNEIIKPENQALSQKLSALVKATDTQIEGIFAKKVLNDEHLNQLVFSKSIELKPNTHIFGTHHVYDNGTVIGEEYFDFKKNISLGTNAMLAIGGMILKKFESGGLVVFDELDNSLHPKITRFFIQLFHNPTVNKANAQIVFSTHEPLLMDKDMFRSEQIWFTQKNKYGETELYSAQDFEGVREDIPFDKWYMAGKFGALPNIQETLLSV